MLFCLKPMLVRFVCPITYHVIDDYEVEIKDACVVAFWIMLECTLFMYMHGCGEDFTNTIDNLAG